MAPSIFLDESIFGSLDCSLRGLVDVIRIVEYYYGEKQPCISAAYP